MSGRRLRHSHTPFYCRQEKLSLSDTREILCNATPVLWESYCIWNKLCVIIVFQKGLLQVCLFLSNSFLCYLETIRALVFLLEKLVGVPRFLFYSPGIFRGWQLHFGKTVGSRAQKIPIFSLYFWIFISPFLSTT